MDEWTDNDGGTSEKEKEGLFQKGTRSQKYSLLFDEKVEINFFFYPL